MGGASSGLAAWCTTSPGVIQERRRTLPENVDDFLKAKAKTKTLDFIDVLLLTKVGSSGTWSSRGRMDFDLIKEFEWM